MKELKYARREQSEGAIHGYAARAGKFWLLTSGSWILSQKNMFFAKRTQFQSMFTAFFEKTESQLKPFQTQFKANF
jgi:hypothetical protein